MAPYPAQDLFGRTTTQMVQVSIDEDLLQSISNQTGSKYFRATDEQKLREIFAEIDQMEKTKVEIRAYRRFAEKFYPWAIAALAALGLGFALQMTLLRGMA